MQSAKMSAFLFCLVGLASGPLFSQTLQSGGFTIGGSTTGTLTSSGGGNFTYDLDDPNYPNGTVTYVGPGSYEWKEEECAAKGVILWNAAMEKWQWSRTFPSAQGPYDFVQ